MPLWFLVLSLFLPRLALFADWIEGFHFPVPQPFAAGLWIFLPRVLVLIMIYHSAGACGWFYIHLVVALLVWTGCLSRARR